MRRRSSHALVPVDLPRRWRTPLAAATIALVVGAGDLRGQGYYNLDAGRPVRVEDATPTPRHELELQLLPVRFERYASGTQRWRSDSKISYGIAPFTEIELRVPVLIVDPRIAGASASMGIGGLAIGGLHALTIETGAIPALAVGAEWSAPVGNLAAPTGSYSANVLLTKTLPFMRLHLNAAVGTWSIRPPVAASGTPCPSNAAPGAVLPPGCAPGPPPDTPCDRAADGGARLACVPASFTRAVAARASTAAADSAQGSTGPRMMAGVGIDHAFALASTVIMADVVAERFTDLYASTDVLGELGMRHQLTPQIVIDIGVGRHFSLATRSTTVTIGLTYERALNARARRAPER